MGHTRLAIVDLFTGGQPLFNQNRDVVYTINGELYDYKQRRAELACVGKEFETKADSEIGLYLYERFGLECVEQLRGEFAIAIYDQEKRRLCLIRDRFGVRPLYYTRTQEGVVYGSEVKAILEHPDVSRRLCRKASLNQLMQTMVPGSTAFEGVYAVKPGTFVVFQDTGSGLSVRHQKYWDIDFPEAGGHWDAADECRAIEAVRDSLIDAVRARLEADVPVGCYLSGGIDSCSMLGLATALQQSPVKAYTISFDHDAYDESAIAKEMAQRARAEQEILSLTASDLYGEHYIKTLWHTERTFYNTLGVAKYHMSKRVKDSGYKVVVTGEGSDELFGGYAFFKQDYFDHAASNGKALNAQLSATNQVVKGALLAEERRSHEAFEDVIGFTPAWLQPWILTLEAVRPLLSSDCAEELHGYDPVAAIAEHYDPAQVHGRHPLDRAQYSWIKTMLEGQILTWGGDRVDMANSMESRPAFLDHHVAQVAKHIAPELRIKNGVEKWVLREAMKGVLPQVLYEREKFAFMAPPAHTDNTRRNAIESLLAEHLSSEQIESLGVCDPKAISGFINRWRETDDSAIAKRYDIMLNHVLGLHVLHQHFVDRSI